LIDRQSGLSLESVATADLPVKGRGQRRRRRGDRQVLVDTATRLTRQHMIANMRDTSSIRAPLVLLATYLIE